MNNNNAFFKKQMEMYRKNNIDPFFQNTPQSSTNQSHTKQYNRSYIGQLLDNIKPTDPKEDIEKLKRQDRERAIGNALSLIGKGVAAWGGITPKPFDNTPFTRNAQQRFRLQQDFDNKNRDYNLLKLSEAKRQAAEDAEAEQLAAKLSAAKEAEMLKNASNNYELYLRYDDKEKQRKADADALDKRLKNARDIAYSNNQSRERIAQDRVSSRTSSGGGTGKRKDNSFVFFDTTTRQEKTLSPAIVTRLEAYMAEDERFADTLFSVLSSDLLTDAQRAMYNNAIITLYNERRAEFEDIPTNNTPKLEAQPPIEKKIIRDATLIAPETLERRVTRLDQ